MTAKIKRVITLVSLTVLITGATAFCGQKEGKRNKSREGNFKKTSQRAPRERQRPQNRDGRDRMHGMMFKKLDLTEKQQQQAKEIFEANSKKIESLNEKMGDIKRKLQDAIMDGKVDSIPGIADNLGKAIGEVSILKAKAQQEFIKILDDEQREKLEDMRKARKEKGEKSKKRKHDQDKDDQDDDRGKKKRKDRKDR